MLATSTARSLTFTSCLVLLAAAGCAADAMEGVSGAPIGGGKADSAGDVEDPGEPEPGSSFVDAQSYFQTDAEFEAWFTITRALRTDFDSVCGDTFCEGEYSNIQSLRFRCAVDAQTGTIGSCVWVLAGSNEDVAPTTGEIAVQGQIFACEMPIDAGTAVADFMQALSAPEPIHAPLPGSELSLYDGLIGCL
jgi:hypothetical protein